MNAENLAEDINKMSREIVNLSKSDFTGNVAISINMNQGGIGQMSVNIQRDLKGSSGKKTRQFRTE